MNRSLLLLPILAVVAAGLALFGFTQVRFERDKFMADLRGKASKVAASMESSARYAMARNDAQAAQRFLANFQHNERILGCIFYDKDGRLIAATPRISWWAGKDRPSVKAALNAQTASAAMEALGLETVYSYQWPVLDNRQNTLGLIDVVYETRSMTALVTEIWKKVWLTLFILIALIVGIFLIAQRYIFVLPMRQLTQWFIHFQKGETDKLRPFVRKGEFGKLAGEVEQVALSLRVARRVVTEEAHETVKKDARWSEAKLRDLVHAKLGDNALFVVSNREPYTHVTDQATGKPRCIRPPSGVVTAIDPILYACGGTWIAQGVTEEDRKSVNSKDKLGVPPGDIRYILKRIWLTKEEEAGYYYGFSNEGLWPLCHVTHTRPIFREEDWKMYQAVNRKFADSVLQELPAKPSFIFIQDYHFTLMPKMIKEARPDVTIALFWHIPWPNPEVFAICPYQMEILDGMLASDLIGFHLQYHCNNFLETANRLIECRVDTEKFSVVRSQKETRVKAFPISVNGYFSGQVQESDRRTINNIRRELNLEDKIMALSVERIDYTKGISERLMALDRFLEKYPQYKKKFVFVQLASPSRTHIKRYQELMEEIDGLVEKKNAKYADGDWKPIIYLKRQFSQEEIRPYYQMADLCIVSPLHDGMNLVAKEFVASKKDLSGALILSRFTGASRELTGAVLINPYAIEEFADAIKTAVEMSPEEKKKRMEGMRQVVADSNVYRWAGNIIIELTSLKNEAPLPETSRTGGGP